MAKVYSWEISNGVYAYIVDPNNTNKALVSRGEITNQKQLQIITDWAQNATDTQYDAQFEKMLTECAHKGYNVQFEDASVYRGVTTTCDNLRGPAGRGISTIEYLRSLTDDDGTFSVYTIKYDDGTDGTLKIREGRDGKDGIDGTPGAPGDSGISSKLIMIYTSGMDADGNIFTPDRPVGGSYNFISNEFVCPDGWSRNDGDDGSLTPPIWQSSRTFASTEASTDRQWSVPVQITGENGKPGEDGTSTEFIYYLGSNPPRGEALPSENVAGFVPVYESWGTTASPEGVDEDNKTEYCYTRTKIKDQETDTSVWGGWNGPTIWSKYGENGQDGDGVQYIFLKNKGESPKNPTPFGYDAFDSTDPKIKEIFENYQNKDVEWLPPTGYQYTNLYGTDVVFKAIEDLPEGSEKEPAGIWTDDPTDVDSEFQFIWVSSRKYRKSQESGKKMWTKFTDPTLWAKFGQDGKNATSIRRLYKLTSSTGTPPDLPEDPTMTADWGTGFPKDYKYGVNVVWATEAEIWAHDFEFVYSYRKVSEVDKDGKVIVPADATSENSLEVAYIPDSQKGYEGITYLIDEYDGHYYKWDGGWCTPFLVTGVKGDPGDPIDYNTYVFAFGYTDYPPAPPTGNSPAFPGESMGENKILVQWYDFPDTSLYRDGIQSNGVDMRWFQCEGQVDGYTKQIKVDDTGKLKWGTVTPCNPRDGEGKTGPYYQFLFGITKDDKEPPKNFIVDGKWERRPAYYVNNEQYGWFDTDDKMPAIPAGGAMWQIWGLIDPETDTVLEVNGKGWNGPRRISGEKGEQGLQGPAGLRGVSGLPGAAQHTMYCLGTYGKDKSEYYFDIYKNPETDKVGDGYFGDKDFQGKTIEDLEKKGWYTTQKMPYSDVIKVVNEKEFETTYKNPDNQGRVIRYIRSTADSTNGSTFVNTTHQYYLVGRGGGYYIQLTGLLSEKESEDFDIYVWCIQGNDKWSKGKSAFYKKLTGTPEDANDSNTQPRNDIPATKVENYKYLRDVATNEYYTWVEIDGGSVEHIYEGVEWSSPFKLQGTNGLRGLAGNRGQVVYPMGVYNHEEVYVTTETKAPYVYDPNDGLFYVYNIVGQPWVGRLPGFNEETREYDDTYKYIMIHPDDAEVNFKEVDYDPTTQRNEVPGYKYLRYNGNYYTWSDTAYVMASKYKYSDDGGLTWMTDQQGDTPANNFANAGTGMSPAWVRFESFQALYTSIGIIANGMIGSAVYNNEFMFSQQGINKQGEKTNYAVVSGKPGDNDAGFLSGYEFDEKGYKVSLGEGKGYIVLHWKYKNSSTYINDTAVNPYEKNENGEYIHAFMPNVCINFSTGQMWLQCGKLRFGQLDKDTNVYTQEEVDKNVEDELKKQKEIIDRQIAETQKELDEMTQKLDDWDNDGLLNPTELKLLKEEYQTIKDEYPSITAQAATVSISSEVYTNTYNKVTGMTDNYYLKPENATATTSTDGSFVSGGDCVVIITDSNEPYWYGWYQKYYEDRQTLLQSISNKLNEKIGDVHNEITAATKTLSDTIAANKKAIEEQVDKRADSYYQDADPSAAWQINDSSITATYADYRVGDLWYDTGDKKSYTFAKGSKGNNAGKASENGTLSNYYWAESDVPAGVYNAINGRSKIFIEKPVPPYFSGDLWFVENDSYKNMAFVGGTGITSGTCMVCITTNDSENAQFKAGDWGRRDRYADEAQLAAAQKELEDMTQQLDDWDNDGLLSPAERKILESEYDSIVAEYPSIIDQAKDVSLNSSDTAVTTTEHYTAYTTYTGTTETVKNVIANYYLKPENATATTSTDGTFVSGGDCVVIITGTTDTTKGYGWIQKYYEDRQTLLKCISEKLNNNISEVHNELTAATKTLSDTIAANKKAIEEQVDKRADSYYQDADPSASWQVNDSSITATYADYRVGDLWYDTGDKKSYVFAKGSKGNNAGKASTNSALSAYYWAESDVPASVYNAINGRSKIFIEKPVPPYYTGDLWFVENNSYTSTVFASGTGITSGTCMVCITTNDSENATFAAAHWGRRDRYADEAQLANAQEELEAMTQKLDDWDNDGLLNPTELKLLKEEYDTIVAEYPSITGQALTVAVSSTNYTNVYNKVTGITENYYLKPENATATTGTNGGFVSGGDCVVIVTGTTATTNWYGWYQKYYEERQALLTAISNQLNSDISEVHNEITAATKTLSDTIAANQKTIQEQVDKRADSYYQDADPSNVTSAKWQTTNTAATSTYAEYRLGDLWYDTGDKKSYTFAKKTNGTMPTAGKASENSALSAYYWAESDVPASVYSSIKGRSKIFVSKPSEEYHVGDLWFLEQDYTAKFYGCTENTTMPSGTIMVAVISGATYAAGNWGRRDRYADEAQLANAQEELIAMNDKLTDWASDNKINESERTVLKRELDSILAEYSSITGQAVTVAVTSTPSYSNYVTAYNNVVRVMNYYITAATDSNGCIDIVSGTTDTTKGYGWIKNYYEKRQALLQKISDKLDSDINDVSDQTILAIGRLDAFSNDNYISPEERRSLKETYDGLSSEYTSITGQAQTLGLTGTTAYTDYTTWKTRAENALKYYSSTANTISDTASTYYGFIKIVYTTTGTTNVTNYGAGAKHYGNIAEYYKKKDILQQKITEKLNQKIDSIDIPEYVDNTWLVEQFDSGTTEFYGGAVLANMLSVKDESGCVRGFMNGSKKSDFKKDDGAIMMLGLGLENDAKYVMGDQIRLYQWNGSTKTDPYAASMVGEFDVETIDEEGDIPEELATIYINASGYTDLHTKIQKNQVRAVYYDSSTGKYKPLTWGYYRVDNYLDSTNAVLYAGATATSYIQPYKLYIDRSGYVRETYFNLVQLTPTRIYDDGSIYASYVNAPTGFFGGQIDSTGNFEGTIKSDESTLKHAQISDSEIVNTTISLSNLRIHNLDVPTGSTEDSKVVDSYYYYRQNSNGTDAGIWYGGGDTEWYTLCEMDVHGQAFTATTPSFTMEYWIYSSGSKTPKTPKYGLRIAAYKSDGTCERKTLRTYGNATANGTIDGGNDYWKNTVSSQTFNFSSGYTKVCIELLFYMHLHTYAWMGTDKSAGSITVTPGSAPLKIKFGSIVDTFQIGKNGIRFSNSSTNALISPKKLELSYKGYGVKVEADGLYITAGSTASWKKISIGSDGTVKAT